MKWHVSSNFSRHSGAHSVSGGTVRTASISLSRFSWSRVFSAVRAKRAWIAASPGSTTSSESTLSTLEVVTDNAGLAARDAAV